MDRGATPAPGGTSPTFPALPPIPPFGVARIPRIVFGAGRIAELPALVREHGTRALLVTGVRSIRIGPAWPALTAGLEAAGLRWDALAVDGEPSPGLVDEAVATRRGEPPDVVVGLGGGSVLDAAKAIAGLLRSGTTTMDHLEGVGRGVPYPGPATPFVAVPTTAGTGSEATKNAVLAEHGPGRLQEVVPRRAAHRHGRPARPGPPGQLPAGPGRRRRDGRADPAPGGVPEHRRVAVHRCDRTGRARGRPRRAARLARGRAGRRPAGIRRRPPGPGWPGPPSARGSPWRTPGLGAVHGLVSPLGALAPVPHGTGCGILLAATTRANIAALRARGAPDSAALVRYATAGRLLATDPALPDEDARGALVETLAAWTAALGLPRLRDFGIRAADLPRIVADARGSSMRTNPVVLTDDELERVLRACR